MVLKPGYTGDLCTQLLCRQPCFSYFIAIIWQDALEVHCPMTSHTEPNSLCSINHSSHCIKEMTLSQPVCYMALHFLLWFILFKAEFGHNVLTVKNHMSPLNLFRKEFNFSFKTVLISNSNDLIWLYKIQVSLHDNVVLATSRNIF